MAKKIYDNKNGCMGLLDFIKLIHSGEYDEWTRKHRVLDDQCPPYELINDKIQCFHCFECQEHCRGKVKEYKNYYAAGKKKKFYKNEL